MPVIHNCIMATNKHRSTLNTLHKQVCRTQTTYNDPFFTARAPSYPICLQATSPVARLNGLSHKEPIPFTARVPLAPPPPVNSTAPYNGTVQSVAGIKWNSYRSAIRTLVSLIIIVYTHCVMNLQQVRWNCKAHEESSSAVMLQSVIFCSPPLQSTVSLPILMGRSVKLAELERQQQDYKYNDI